MVDDALLSDSDFVVPMMYLVLRLETPRMSCMRAPLFDIGLIGLDVPNLVQSIIGSDIQSYEGY